MPAHRIFCDFDGTITRRDSIVFLTERFGAGQEFRQDMLAAITSGRMTVFEAVRQEMATVKISWEEAARALQDEVPVDPTFVGFVRWCEAEGVPLTVVSSGLQPVLELYLADLDVEFFAHPVQITTDGWIYEKKEEHEKSTLLNSVPDDRRELVYIGDGTSDVEVISHVDLLFAKSYLAGYCQQHGHPFVPFNDFVDIQQHLEAEREKT